MAQFQVVEKFVSINGEGRRAGELAVFIRFKGCNLNCSYCDTKWANEEEASFVLMTEQEIYEYVISTGVKNVTLTGGEPLLRAGMTELLALLGENLELRVEIETNGSIDLAPFIAVKHRPSFTMDYKSKESGMEDYMLMKNFELLDARDTVKFVVGSYGDMETAKKVIEEYHLQERMAVYFSPIFGQIDPKDMVAFLIEHQLNDVKLQLQLHKFIWDPNETGV